ncbi:MAG: phytanoyl-CoA dioxygenase family protein [Sphingopyxis sp.]|nr:phytanoyl-CoA dioxygenase family protein [Sphingopyxis sp.]
MSTMTGVRLPQPTRDLEQGKRDLTEFGYCIHLDVIDADEVRALRERLDEQARLEREQGVAWLGNGGRGGNTWVGSPRDGEVAPWQGVRTLLNKGRVFVDLAMNPVIQEYQRHVFNSPDFYLSGSNGLIVRKGAVPMVIHTDQIHVPFDTPIPLVSNVMITLSDFREDMGATRFLPGSHRMTAPQLAIDWEKLDAYNPDPVEGMVTAECPPGAAIVFEGRLWHSSGCSVSDEVRYSISTYFALPFMRAQDAYAASLHDDVYAGMTDAEKAMAGFKVSTVGRIDPRSPGDRSNVGAPNPYIPELRAGSPARAIPAEQEAAPFAGTVRPESQARS